jgi:hypothetical protein
MISAYNADQKVTVKRDGSVHDGIFCIGMVLRTRFGWVAFDKDGDYLHDAATKATAVQFVKSAWIGAR